MNRFKKIISYIIVYILLNLSILLHEGAHFITAKLTGVNVLEFVVGIGPNIYKSGVFSIHAIPIGGFLFLDINMAKPWKMILIFLSGPLINLVLFLILKKFIIKIFFFDDHNYLSDSNYEAQSVIGLTISLANLMEYDFNFTSVLKVFGILNLELSFFNSFPIPPFDGYKVIINIIYLITGPFDLFYIEFIFIIGIIVFCLFLIFRDIYKVIKEKFIIKLTYYKEQILTPEINIIGLPFTGLLMIITKSHSYLKNIRKGF